MTNWPSVNVLALFPWPLDIYQLCYLRIVPTGKMTLIDKLSLVWEELEIHYKCLERSSQFWVSLNVLTFLSCPSSYTRTAMPMDLSETLAALGHEASKPKWPFCLPDLNLSPCTWLPATWQKEVCAALRPATGPLPEENSWSCPAGRLCFPSYTFRMNLRPVWPMAVVMDSMCVPLSNSYIEALNPNVMVFAGGAFGR